MGGTAWALVLFAAAQEPPADLPPTPPVETPADTSPRIDAPAPATAPPESPAAPPPAAASSAARRLSAIVLDLKSAGSVSADEVRQLSQLVTVELGSYQALDVKSGAEVRQLVDLEGEKQELGCEQSASCLAEIAGALGARVVVFGDVGRLGSRLLLNLSVHDTRTGEIAGRVSLQGDAIEPLADGIPDAVAKLVNPFLVAEKLSSARSASALVRAPSSAAPFSWKAIAAVASIAGAAVLATSYAGNIAIWKSFGAPSSFMRPALAPVIGPWQQLDLFARDNHPDDEDGFGVLMIGVGIAQGAGALAAAGGGLFWATATVVDEPPLGTTGELWRWGLVGAGAASVAAGVALDVLPASSRDHLFTAADLAPPALYLLGAATAIVGLATTPFAAGSGAD